MPTLPGTKHDGEKDRWDLLPLEPIAHVVRVLTLGARKYAPDNWKLVPDWRDRYYAAALRHITAWRKGEKNDAEWGLPHLAHAVCCLIFILWLDEQIAPTASVRPFEIDPDFRANVEANERSR